MGAELRFSCFSPLHTCKHRKAETPNGVQQLSALHWHAGTLCRPACRGCVNQRSPRADQRVASEPTTGSTVTFGASVIAATVLAAASRSPRGAQRVAGLAITGSTPAAPPWLGPFWLRPSCTAIDATMKAPRKPAARVIGLRPVETKLLDKTETKRTWISVWEKLVLSATEW